MLDVVGLLEPVRLWRQKRALQKQRSKALRLFAGFLQPGELCFDIGANIGDICDLVLCLGARVIAVEPQKQNVEELTRRFRGNPSVVIVPKAVGATRGRQELFVCSASDCSSMSKAHISAVTASGRLPTPLYRWEDVELVEVTTLSDLIAEYGLPAFVKIDVEGFEAEVARSLTQPIPALSFEFTPENLGPAIDCIEHLMKLGHVRLNYSVGRKMQLELPRWTSGQRLIQLLRSTTFPIYLGPGGEIYARFE